MNLNLFLWEIYVCSLYLQLIVNMLNLTCLYNQQPKVLINLAKRLSYIILMIDLHLLHANLSTIRFVLHASHAAKHNFCFSKKKFIIQKSAER